MRHYRSITGNATAQPIRRAAASIDDAVGARAATPPTEEKLGLAPLFGICGVSLGLWSLIGLAAYAILR